MACFPGVPCCDSFHTAHCLVISTVLNNLPGNCVLIGSMKQLLIPLLLLVTTACQSATPTPVAPLFPTGTAFPSPVPATDTPTSTFTPEPTMTPFPRFFTTEFDSDSSMTGWVMLQAGNDSVPTVSVEGNQLHVQTDSTYTWVYGLYQPEDYDNIRIDTKFVNNAMSPASAGLICHYSDKDGWLEYNVTTDGTYNMLYGKWLSSGVADYLPIVDGSSNAIPQSGMDLQIGLICSGTTASLLINDTVIRNVDVSRFELASGKAGLAASSYENTPVIVSFDWFKVSEP
jgi:hypothetical protein